MKNATLSFLFSLLLSTITYADELIPHRLLRGPIQSSFWNSENGSLYVTKKSLSPSRRTILRGYKVDKKISELTIPNFSNFYPYDGNASGALVGVGDSGSNDIDTVIVVDQTKNNSVSSYQWQTRNDSEFDELETLDVNQQGDISALYSFSNQERMFLRLNAVFQGDEFSLLIPDSFFNFFLGKKYDGSDETINDLVFGEIPDLTIEGILISRAGFVMISAARNINLTSSTHLLKRGVFIINIATQEIHIVDLSESKESEASHFSGFIPVKDSASGGIFRLENEVGAQNSYIEISNSGSIRTMRESEWRPLKQASKMFNTALRSEEAHCSIKNRYNINARTSWRLAGSPSKKSIFAITGNDEGLYSFRVRTTQTKAPFCVKATIEPTGSCLDYFEAPSSGSLPYWYPRDDSGNTGPNIKQCNLKISVTDASDAPRAIKNLVLIDQNASRIPFQTNSHGNAYVPIAIDIHQSCVSPKVTGLFNDPYFKSIAPVLLWNDRCI